MDSKVCVIKKDIDSYSNNSMISSMVREAIDNVCNIREIIRPGMNVLIKPNWVMDRNHNKEAGTECLYTQVSVIRAVLDYVCESLEFKGKVCIGDAPMQSCVFEKIIGIQELGEAYKDKEQLTIEIADFRETKAVVKNGIVYADTIAGDGVVVDLGFESEFFGEKNLKDLRITNYDPGILQEHHSNDVHEYRVTQRVLDADVIINMPKPKSHRKAGTTISLKNMIGVNAKKEYLPHHKLGAPSDGGDEYSERNYLQGIQSGLIDKKTVCEAEKKYKTATFLSLLITLIGIILKRMGVKVFEGNWYGNDTISKTIVDINKIVKYADKMGTLLEEPQREMLIVADMIISGEKDGPVAPDAKRVGIIAAGTNPVCFDEAISTVMGFDPLKIPSIVRSRKTNRHRLVEKNMIPFILSNVPEYNKKRPQEISRSISQKFIPTDGWYGHIESN